MLHTQNRHRTTIPATGLGSILVATPQLALVADRGVVAAVAVAVGLGEESFGAGDRRSWDDVAPNDRPVGSAGDPVRIAVAAGNAPTQGGGSR